MDIIVLQQGIVYKTGSTKSRLSYLQFDCVRPGGVPRHPFDEFDQTSVRDFDESYLLLPPPPQPTIRLSLVWRVPLMFERILRTVPNGLEIFQVVVEDISPRIASMSRSWFNGNLYSQEYCFHRFIIKVLSTSGSSKPLFPPLAKKEKHNPKNNNFFKRFNVRRKGKNVILILSPCIPKGLSPVTAQNPIFPPLPWKFVIFNIRNFKRFSCTLSFLRNWFSLF